MSRLEFQPDPNQDDELESALEEDTASQRLAMPETAERLHYVENLLRNVPLLSVPIGFADRVMAVIKRQDPDDPNYQDGMGIVLGLLMAALIAIPLFGIVAWLFIRALVSLRAQATLVDDLESVFTGVSLWLASLSADGVIVVPLIVAMVVGLMFFSGYVIWFVRELFRSN